MVETKDYNCYEYWLACTEEYGEYWAAEHFGRKYYRSELDEEVKAFAAYAQKGLGLKPGDVYTVFIPTMINSIVAFYALNRIGVIVNFVHPLMPAEFLKQTMQDVHSKGVMVLDLLSLKHAKVINESGLPCCVCSLSDYSSTPRRAGLRVGENLVRGIYPKIKNRINYHTAIKKYYGIETEIAKNCWDTAVYLNGGGTTGKSKTIMLTSHAINDLVWRISKYDRIFAPGEEMEIIVLPLFHCFGLCVAVHMAICNAARLIPMMQFDAERFNKLMMKYRCVGFVGIPNMFKKLMNEKHFDGEHLKNLRVLWCGGDDVSDAFIDEFNSYMEKYGALGRLYQGYGLTEVGSVCTVNNLANHRRGSIGKAVDGVTVQIWDENHNELPRGTVGEICISGPTIMQGYYKPEDDADNGLYVDENGVEWVQSGDLAYEDEDGYFFFSGRKKRVIIISGYNVYPSDVEKQISDLPFVKEACCVKGYLEGRQIMRLFVVYSENGDHEDYKKKIIEFCENNFSKFSVPKDIVVMDSLPQTPLMKIDFMKLTQEKPGDPLYSGKEAIKPAI